MSAKKSLGQHFLTCRWVADTLIRAADIGHRDTVLEIGPGTGALTYCLAAAAGRVIAVEKDERLASQLKGALKKEGINNVEIILGDALSIFQTKSGIGISRLSLELGDYKIVANIPYYLTSHLLRLVLEHKPRPKLIALTIQKEVARRMVARPPHMNLLALSVQAYGTPEIIKTVPSSCFSPQPKVDSAIIKISGISDIFFQKNALGREEFFRLIRAGFGQKRKQLANTLATIVGDKKRAENMLRAADINPASRPEELSLIQWAELCRATVRD